MCVYISVYVKVIDHELIYIIKYFSIYYFLFIKTVRNGPFSQDCDDVFISILNPQNFLYFGLKNMYIYNTILCIISHLYQITKKLVNANARVFLMQRLWKGR